MNIIMGQILDAVVSWVYSTVAALLNFISGGLLDSIGCNLTEFNSVFPGANKLYAIIQGFSFALLILIFLFQLVKNYCGPLSDGENPLGLILKTFLFMGPVLFGENIFEFLLKIFSTPYNKLLKINALTNPDWGSIANAFKNKDTVTKAMISNSAGGVSDTIVSLFALFILIGIGWNFFKLVLECAERYVVIGVLAYTAPLPLATGASKSTSNVFKSWCRMAISQCVMLLLNVWSVKIVLSSFGSIATALSTGKVLVWAILIFGFLKVAQKLDAYMAQLGMCTAQTGGSLLEEIAVTASGIKGAMSKISGNLFGSEAGGILGAMGVNKKAADSIRSTFSGTTAAAAAVATGAAGFAGAKPDGKGGFTGGGGIMGSLAQRAGAKKFMDGINGGANKSFADHTTGKIANGDINKFGTLSDNPNAKTADGKTIASQAFSSYFKGDKQGVGKGVSNVSMGGGHIMGTTADGQKFDMYSAGKYQRPEGVEGKDFTSHTAADGTNWYRQVTPMAAGAATVGAAAANSAKTAGAEGAAAGTTASRVDSAVRGASGSGSASPTPPNFDNAAAGAGSSSGVDTSGNEYVPDMSNVSGSGSDVDTSASPADYEVPSSDTSSAGTPDADTSGSYVPDMSNTSGGGSNFNTSNQISESITSSSETPNITEPNQNTPQAPAVDNFSQRPNNAQIYGDAFDGDKPDSNAGAKTVNTNSSNGKTGKQERIERPRPPVRRGDIHGGR